MLSNQIYIENCFFDIHNFTLTQVNYVRAPAVVNYRRESRQH